MARGQTALYKAAGKVNTFSTLKILIGAGADVNIVDNYRQTPLHIPVDNKNVRKLHCLIRNNSKIDLKDQYGRTALHIAAGKPYCESILKILINAGADINTTDNAGETPLSNAVLYEIHENVKILSEAGAAVNFVCKADGKSLIFKTKSITILETLLLNGAKIKDDSPLNSLLAKQYIGPKNLKRLIDAGCDINHVNKDGNTLLIIATKYNDLKLLELLVQEGADVNASSTTCPQLTAVMALLSDPWGYSYPERVASCIEYLLDQNAQMDNVHSGAVNVFITTGALSLIPKLISRGCSPIYLSLEQPSYSWFTLKTNISPLMMALLLDQSDLAQYFINIKYLVKSDIAILSGERFTLIELEYLY